MDPNRAVIKIRELFKDAEKAGHLVATWNILCALRGPDNNNDNDKLELTTPIRQFVLTKKQAFELHVSNNWEYEEKFDAQKIYDTIDGKSDHFYNHITYATEAIMSNHYLYDYDQTMKK